MDKLFLNTAKGKIIISSKKPWMRIFIRAFSIPAILVLVFFSSFGEAWAAVPASAYFKPQVSYPAGSGSVASGDFNKDGWPDLAVTEYGGAGEVYILMNNKDGTFAASVPYSTPTASSVAVGDFNKDGWPDLAVTDYLDYKVYVLMNNKDGTFAAGVTYGTGYSPLSVTVGDFNCDGYPDLAVANEDSNTITVLFNNGDGTFAAGVTYGTGNYPSSAAVGDFNGDNYPDLVVANADFFGGTVSVLLNNGNGTFKPKTDYSVGDRPCSVMVGDFNCDNYPDLAVVNNFSDNVSILLNKGDGTFNPKTNYTVSSSPCNIVVGDFNGDHYPDLAVTISPSGGSGCVSVLLDDGSGAFSITAAPDTVLNADGVAVGDFNSDGQLDLAAANYIGDVCIIINDTAPALKRVVFTGSIPSLVVGGNGYDLNNLALQGRDQHDNNFDITSYLGGVTWNVSGNGCASLSNGHYLTPSGSSGTCTVTSTVYGLTSNSVSITVQTGGSAGLAGLSTSAGVFAPVFDSNTVAYHVSTASPMDSIDITATLADPAASLKINGSSATSGVAQAVYLNQGTNLIPMVVTAVDGVTQKAYVISVNGTVSNANLSSLSVSSGDIGFSPTVTNYTQPVASNTSSLTVTASQSDPKALMFVNGSPLSAGVARTVYLNYSANSIEVMVVAQDATVKTYTINVIRSLPPITWNTGSLQASNINSTGLTLTWPAASCDAGITGYEVYQGADLLSTVTGSVYSYNAVGLDAGTGYIFSVKAVDTAGNKSDPLSVTVTTRNLSSLGITTSSLPAATIGTAYSITLTAGGGTTPYTWSVSGLPAGLSLNTSTGEITGTPTAAGTWVANITLTDSQGASASRGFTLTVFYPAGTGKYAVTPISDTAYTSGTTVDGFIALTVNSGVTGYKTFTVNIAVAESHSGDETVIFVQLRNDVQINLNATYSDFDVVTTAKAGFNVQPGDIIKVYIVDELTNDEGHNPTLLQ